MTEKKKAGFFESLWKFLISIRLTLIMLFLLSIACVVGTVVPQKAAPQEYLKLYSESTYELFKTVGFTDLFGSNWFQILLCIFNVNLIGCTLDRLPRIWRLVFKTQKELDDKTLPGLTAVRKFTPKNFGPEEEKQTKENLDRFLGKMLLFKSGDQLNYFSQKGRVSRLGSTITHIGLVLVFVGGVMGNLGFQGYMQLTEGQQKDIVYLKDGSGTKKLDFSIRCDDFEVTYYENSQRPKDYKSELTVIDGGREVMKKVIEVNVPLIYKGIYFYQSSYGTDLHGGGEVVLLLKERGRASEKRYRVDIGGSFRVDNSEDTVWVESFLPDFAMNADGRPFSKSSQMRNPAVYLKVEPKGKAPYHTWAFAKFPNFHKKSTGGYEIVLEQFFPKQYTGLQATKDPGVWIVWVGCALMVLGIYAAFFTSHRRIWLRVEERDGKYTATLAGSTNKNTAGFKREFEKLFKNIKS